MNLAALDAAIEQANRVFSRDYRADSTTIPVPRREEAAIVDATVPGFSAPFDEERRFGQPHERLFPFLGRKVRTPAGLGTLLQVFADRCTVVLDSHVAHCARFAPGEIEPVTWELEP